MTVKKLDLSKQICFAQQIAGEMKVYDMTVSLFKDGQNQVYSLQGCLASFQFPSTANSNPVV